MNTGKKKQSKIGKEKWEKINKDQTERGIEWERIKQREIKSKSYQRRK